MVRVDDAVFREAGVLADALGPPEGRLDLLCDQTLAFGGRKRGKVGRGLELRLPVAGRPFGEMADGHAAEVGARFAPEEAGELAARQEPIARLAEVGPIDPIEDLFVAAEPIGLGADDGLPGSGIDAADV